MLFSGLGARLWFLQTVEAQSLQQVVDQRNTRTVLIAPERGQIFDHDGRLLAGNEPIYNVAVDWAAMRRSADRAALFSRLSGWVGVPVEDMEARFDSGDFETLRPLPIAEDVPEDVVIALSERSEDFPGVTMVKSYRRIYPYAPLAAHVVGYMGAITEQDAAHYRNLGYDTSNRGEEVGRAGVELGIRDHAARTVGRDRLRGRLPWQRCARDQPEGRGQRDGRALVHRSRSAAVRRTSAADPTPVEAGVHRAQPDHQEA